MHWIKALLYAGLFALMCWIISRSPQHIRSLQVPANEIRIIPIGYLVSARIPRADEDLFHMNAQYRTSSSDVRQFSIRVDRANLPLEDTGVYIAGTNPSLDLRVNGIPYGDTASTSPRLLTEKPERLLEKIPENYLHPGNNRFDPLLPMRERHSGISGIYVGSHVQLAAFDSNRRNRAIMLNLIMFLGGFMAIIGGIAKLLSGGLSVSGLGKFSAGCFALLVASLPTLGVEQYTLYIIVPICLMTALTIIAVSEITNRDISPLYISGLFCAMSGAIILVLLNVGPFHFDNVLTLQSLSILLFLPLFFIFLPQSFYKNVASLRQKLIVQSEQLKNQQQMIDAQERRLIEQAKLAAVQEERQRFTRDMHDGIGGQLLSLLVRVRSGRADLKDVEHGISDGLSDLRLVVDSMDNVGESLGSALATFQSRAQAQLSADTIVLKWTQDPDVSNIDLGTRKTLHLYRIMQEALTNISRHSGASKVGVDITRASKRLQVKISDNGKGFKGGKKAGKGLKNMRDRARKLGAEFSIKSARNGTEITLAVPIKDPAS